MVSVILAILMHLMIASKKERKRVKKMMAGGAILTLGLGRNKRGRRGMMAMGLVTLGSLMTSKSLRVSKKR